MWYMMNINKAIIKYPTFKGNPKYVNSERCIEIHSDSSEMTMNSSNTLQKNSQFTHFNIKYVVQNSYVGTQHLQLLACVKIFDNTYR